MFKIIKEDNNNNNEIYKFLKSLKINVNDFIESILSDIEENGETATKEDLIKAFSECGIKENEEIYEISSESDHTGIDYSDISQLEDNVYELLEDGEDLGIEIDWHQWIGAFETKCGKIISIGDGYNSYLMNKQTFINVINMFLNEELH